MYKEIKSKYGEFSDSWIESIKIKEDIIILRIVCANKLNLNKYEIIKLKFDQVLFYNLNKIEDKYVIKDVFTEYKEEKITFDADPVDYFDYLKENKNSNFKIIAKKVSVIFVNYFSN